MYILGISAFYHDSAACLIKNGEIIAAVQEERFTRKKHDQAFPSQSIKYCLKEANIDAEQINSIVFRVRTGGGTERDQVNRCGCSACAMTLTTLSSAFGGAVSASSIVSSFRGADAISLATANKRAFGNVEFFERVVCLACVLALRRSIPSALLWLHHRDLTHAFIRL